MSFPEAIIAAFGARPTGRPQTWWASCPLHGGRRNRHLSLWMAGGKLLLGCWGCRAKHNGSHAYKRDLLAAVGLRMGDLFADKENRDFVPHVQRRIVAVYGYTDEEGRVLYEKVRFEPKDFTQRRPCGLSGLGNVRRVPYLLPDLLARPDWPVLIVGGEKDAETALSLDLLATCTTEGEGSGWGLDSPYPPYFVGRRCVVIPDEDRAGLLHARQVVGALVLGGAASVRLCRLPGLQWRETRGLDLSDFVATFATPAEARAALIAAVTASREWR